MAEGKSMNHPSGLPFETQVSSKGAGNGGGMEKLGIFLKLAKHCMEAVQGMPSAKFNNEQCGYLADKLEAVVQSANSFLADSQAQPQASCSIVDIARWVEIFKLVLALARQVERFVHGCCKEAWMQTAMTLANVAEYVSSLGFNLELCRVGLSKECAATGSLALDEVGKISKEEAEIVETKAFTDVESLLKKVTLELNSSKAEDRNLAKYLLHRLVRVGPNPTSDDDSVLVQLFEWVTSGKKAEQLGRGASAKVYKVMWLGAPVAKKTFDGPENEEFLQEVKILSQLCHPNITSMFCCNMNRRSCSIIMELMDGNLHDLMQSRLEGNSDSPPFSILEGVDIMHQVGEGVRYLHSKRIVHRDLKSMNILVKSAEGSELELGYVQAKVVDFGLSKTKESSTTYSNMTYNMGTSRWMAPEVMRLIPSSEGGDGGNVRFPKNKFKCDIYSFGMVCFEILTGDVPFQCEVLPKDVKKKVLGGLRPKLPDHCPPVLKDLIEKCWSEEPTERPTMDDVCSQLKHLKYLLMTSKSFQSIVNPVEELPVVSEVVNTGDRETPEEPSVVVEKVEESLSLISSGGSMESMPGVVPKNPSWTSWAKGELLGSGTIGTIYEGVASNGTFFAVIEVSLLYQGRSEKQAIRQLEQEIALLSELQHPNIVQYLGTERDEENLYIFLELASKGSLVHVYNKYELFNDQVRSYTKQILAGLKYLHDRKIIHRDIKCANILVDASGVVKLADFGMAKQTDKLDLVKSFMGSAHWMAPEVVNPKRSYNLMADIWSLGCTVLEMAIGKPPFGELEVHGVLWKVGHGEGPPIPDDLPEDLNSFISNCLEVNVALRPTCDLLMTHPFITGAPMTGPVKLVSTPELSSHAEERSIDMSSNTSTASNTDGAASPGHNYKYWSQISIVEDSRSL